MMKSAYDPLVLLFPAWLALIGCVPLETEYGGQSPSSMSRNPSRSGYSPQSGYPQQPGGEFAAGQGIGGRPPGAAPYQPYGQSGNPDQASGGFAVDPNNRNFQPLVPGAGPSPGISGAAAGPAGGVSGPGQGNVSSESGAGSAKPPASTAGSDHPRGIPVRNMPGHVYSPYSRDQGIVDVSEWPSGTLVKDPFKPTEDLWFYVP